MPALLTIISNVSGICVVAAGAMVRLTGWLGQWTWQKLVIGALIFVVTFVVATGVVSFVIIKLPANYFHPDYDREVLKGKHPAIRWAGVIGKNLAGLILILVGIVMSLPGVPGPGVVTILFGIMLLDFPGKRGLERKLVSRPSVLKTINNLRRKYDKPPLVL